MFRRRKADQPAGTGSDDAVYDDAGYDDGYDEPAGQVSEAPTREDGGPWDAEEAFPERDRVDLGSLWVPVGPGHEVQLVMAEQLGAWVTIRHGPSELQVQAFAAARRDALWDDVRSEIAAEISAAGGSAAEGEGPFGAELIAEVPADPSQPADGLRTVRFIGVDGPRWFVRGLLGGPASTSAADAEVLLDVFRDIVVSRGEHPVPPRDLLELRLPPEAQAMAEQAMTEEAQEEGRFHSDLNPFERGPEFTETR